MTYVSINHDPFGRFELIRRSIREDYYVPQTCDWCGRPARFRYGTINDDSCRPNWDIKIFCGIGCYRIYHS